MYVYMYMYIYIHIYMYIYIHVILHDIVSCQVFLGIQHIGTDIQFTSRSDFLCSPTDVLALGSSRLN